MMNARILIASLAVATIGLQVPLNAQVSIRNVTAANPDSRAVLDLDWSVGNPVLGLLAPRMTAAQRTGIGATAANSLLVYQTDVNSPHGYWFYDTALPTPGWVRVGQG